MLDSLWFSVVIGLILGWLSGLGVGGGTLLILWLSFAAKLSAGEARAINLMFFILCAGVVSLIRFKNKTLHIRRLLPAMIAGCISAGIFAWVSTVTDTHAFRKLFGILLLITGARELFYRFKEAK